MVLKKLINEYEGERTDEIRGIFSSISILQNRLQTLFDKTDTKITMKQFMLLTMLRHSKGSSYTELGKLLGSSRQNIKKLAVLLEKNGFIKIESATGKNNRVQLTLTDYAESYFEKVYADHTTILSDIFADYTDEEIHLFYGLITRLYVGVEREEGK
ncbi:MarR family transcriptional regulator [Enterococcus sp. JM4C]|uniref:MarR family transcriptional regulator n=1 Tax=Candidatus Enterococcus huntleyi TaxID=1857217 RepID=UPI001379BC8F|nr:MarR family transcriptional regulator [Enterococcus sp. JM4C]KAF1298445.1 MarR family transcriptional regulator [Enterococcus sp. JM4C]